MLGTGKQEDRWGSLASCLAYLMNFKPARQTYLKRTKNKQKRWIISGEWHTITHTHTTDTCTLVSVCTHMQSHVHTYAHTYTHEPTHICLLTRKIKLAIHLESGLEFPLYNHLYHKRLTFDDLYLNVRLHSRNTFCHEIQQLCPLRLNR